MSKNNAKTRSKSKSNTSKSQVKERNKLITSYYNLNQIYDLNFSDNNFGFTWEIFKDFVTDYWAAFYTSKCFYRWAPTARKTRKTWGWCAFDLFMCCNFLDVSMLEIRRYENTHPDTTIADLINVTEQLYLDYGLELGPDNPHGIQWKFNKEGGYIEFPGGQRIEFMGYANGNRIFGKAAKGSSFIATRTDEIIMSEERETLTDAQLDKRYTRLQDSLFRSNRLNVSDIPIKEWVWTYIDDNELSPTYGEEITGYFHKLPIMAFTCNPYDKSHFFYKKYVIPYLPLNDTVKKSLKKTGVVWFEDEEAFSELGLFIIRFTVQPFWDKLPPITKKLMLDMKKRDYQEYETAFYGFEYSGDDISTFVYRQAIKNIRPYNLQDFKTKNEKYKFDFYAVGLDWATGSQFYTMGLPFGFKEIKSTGYYAIYFLCELAAAPKDFLDENEKIAQYIEEFAAINDNFNGFENSFYHYDHNAETAISVIQKGLIDKHDLFIKKSKAIKHRTNIHNEAAIVDRVIWLKSLLASGFVFANKEDIPVTWEMLEELRYSDNRTNMPDQKMLHDAVDAIFYALYPYRHMLPNKNFHLKNKMLLLNA